MTKKRRELTPEEIRAAERLRAIYGQKQEEWKRNGRKLTQERIAAHFDWSGQSIISQYLNGTIPLNLDVVVKFAEFFNVSVESISPPLAERLSRVNLYDRNVSTLPENNNAVPLLSWLQAVSVQGAVDLSEVGDAERWILCPASKFNNKTYALQVRGESMKNPEERHSFDDGDIIFVDPELKPVNKSLIIAHIPTEEEATFKQLLIEDGKRYLKALNPGWPNRITELPDDGVICGVVTGKTVIFE